MKVTYRHLLRVEAGAEHFAALVSAAREAGLRLGWLDLVAPPKPPPALEAAARLGVLRAVGVRGGRSVAVKPIRGAPVLRDLLREHFAGCAAVLVRGEVEAPLLRPVGERWRVEPSAGGEAGYTTDELLALLRRPRPFGGAG